MAAPPTLTLIHSPLVGPTTWKPTAEVLRRNGYRVHTPTMAVTAPPYHHNLATAIPDEPAVLVVHSGAGALVPAIRQAKAAIFVDALLPHPGRSWFDTAPPEAQAQLRGLAADGVLPPWHEWFPGEAMPEALVKSEIPRLPLTYFEERSPQADPVPSAYIRLSEAYDAAADEAGRRGWWVHRENAHHLAMLTDPDRIADLIVIGLTHLPLA
jgi:hypothetical protein